MKHPIGIARPIDKVLLRPEQLIAAQRQKARSDKLAARRTKNSIRPEKKHVR